MLSYEEAGAVLDELCSELPEGIFDKLNGGVSFIEDENVSEDGRYTLGTYFTDEMGRYIELYYGSFVGLYGDMSDEQFRDRLKSTLHHELTHHIESLAGDRSLERWDERQGELYGFNGIEVHSILFVDDDNSLSQVCEAVFNSNRQGSAASVICSSCGVEAGAEFPKKITKTCDSLSIAFTPKHQRAVTRVLLEAHDIALCLTAHEADELSRRFQDLDERVMCFADEDIEAPALPLGWKKCIKRLEDETLAVIDELNQEAEGGV